MKLYGPIDLLSSTIQDEGGKAYKCQIVMKLNGPIYLLSSLQDEGGKADNCQIVMKLNGPADL